MSEDMEVKRAEMEKNAAEINASRSGKGLRVFVGATRGRSTTLISYEGFDTSKPDTLPETLEELATIANITDEKTLVAFAIEGYNDAAYRNASDPLADYINQNWPDETKAKFKVTVRSYAVAMEMSLDDAAVEIADKLNKKFGTA